MSHPIPILKFRGSRPCLDVAAVGRIFRKIGDRHFALMSINGMFRTGKSLMLNFFIQYLRQGNNRRNDWFKPNQLENVFHWRGGAKADTSGIDLWPEPFILKGQDGKEICILLMDTQGSFDDNTSLQSNAVIFAISALLSSSMTLNVMKDVSEDVLQFFQYFCGFAQLAMSDPNEEESSDQMFQRLTFLIRDFPHIRDYPLGYYTARTSQNPNYVRDRLVANSNRQPENNFIRNQLALTFPSMGVYMLPYPGNELDVEDDLTNLGTEFHNHAKKFVEMQFSPENLIPKEVGGTRVSGNQFLKYIEIWAKIFDL